jgi:uncharacterized protein YneF (UPF0154 family)
MEMIGPQLVPVIAALVVGAVAGSWLERWLLWRQLTDASWVFRRLRWMGARDGTRASDNAAQFAALAVIIRIRNPVLMAMWLLHAYRPWIAGLGLVVIVAAGVAIWLK